MSTAAFSPRRSEPTADHAALDRASQMFEPSAGDALGRLEQATSWLLSELHTLAPYPERIFKRVDQVDDLVHRDRLVLTREYLAAAGRMQRGREQRIWEAVVRFARALAGGYEACLGLFQAGVARAAPRRSLLPVIGARTLRALAVELRWTLLRYAAVEPTIWARMGSVYSICERADLDRATFKVYPRMEQVSSVRREYLRALLLAVSGMENLLPSSQVIAERAIAYVAEFFLLHRKAARGCLFAVELDASHPPQRLNAVVPVSKSWRFFGPGDAGVLINGLAQRTVQSGNAPAELRLLDAFAPNMVVEVLQHLSQFWGPTPPMRSELRQSAFSMINVAHGFEDVFAAISDGLPGADEELTEVWTVENESGGGFGASLPAQSDDWLSVGMLVASRPTHPTTWSVGTVRRVSTDYIGRRSVGVQLLGHAAKGVRLQPTGEAMQSGPLLKGVLLPGSQSSMEEIAIVVRKDTVVLEQNYQLNIDEHTYTVVPRMEVEHGVDYSLMCFAIRPQGER